jgi:hypothetical protein
MTRVDAYLRSLSVELRTRFINDAQIIDEVGGHLADAVEAARQQGADDDDAQRCAVAQFGAPEVIGAAFAADRTWARHRVLLVLAGFAGVAVAYVDSRPTWDDTGVTAGAMFLFAAVLGLLGPQRPWLWALTVGAGVPAYAVLRKPAVGTLMLLAVLVFPFAGAYLGRVVRVLAQTPRPGVGSKAD